MELFKQPVTMPTQKDYIEYLRDNGYDVDEVFLMYRGTNEVFTPGGIGKTIEEISKEYEDLKSRGLLYKHTEHQYVSAIEAFGLVKNNADTTSFLQNVIDRNLRAHCKLANIYLPDNILVGVFPTNMFNAQAVQIKDGYLALLNTGIIEFIEAFVELYFLKMIPETVKASFLSLWIKKYIQMNQIPSLEEREALDKFSRSFQQRESGLISYFITAAEEFILLHEYSHCILNHFNEKNTVQSYIKLSHFQEHEADLLATYIQIQKSIRVADDDMAEIKVTGIFITLGLAHLFSYFQNTLETDSHPNGLKRIYTIQKLLKRIEKEKTTEFGYQFLDLIFLAIDLFEKQSFYQTNITGIDKVVDDFFLKNRELLDSI